MDDRKNNTGHKEQQGHGNIGDIDRGQTNIYRETNSEQWHDINIIQRIWQMGIHMKHAHKVMTTSHKE